MAAAIRELSSFVYEDLVSHVEKIRDRTNDMKKMLDHRCQIKKSLFDELKSRSLVFIDPYGNRMIDKHFDHEYIIKVIEKYKKDYVPKYLQSWIKIGIMNDNNIISPLNNFELKSAVWDYQNDYPLISYGQIILWIGDFAHSSAHKFDLNVLLTDNLDKIKSRIAHLGQRVDIQLKLCTINECMIPNEDHWNEGIILKSEDTIMSCQLYQNNRIILGKFGFESVNDRS